MNTYSHSNSIMLLTTIQDGVQIVYIILTCLNSDINLEHRLTSQKQLTLLG